MDTVTGHLGQVQLVLNREKVDSGTRIFRPIRLLWLRPLLSNAVASVLRRTAATLELTLKKRLGFELWSVTAFPPGILGPGSPHRAARLRSWVPFAS